MTEAPTRSRLLVLGALTALGSLGTHMFVPALPAAAAELGSSPSAMQQAISAYVFGLALGHLLWGPVSDRFGHVPMLLAAIGAFLIASFACALANGVELLLAARIVQAVGGSGTLIICRALVADESAPEHVASSLSILFAVTLASPALAPLIGGVITATLGWRSIFLLLGLLAGGGLIYVWRRVRPAGRARDFASSADLMRGAAWLLKSPRFIAFAVANGFMVTGFYLFLTASPFILTEAHRLSPTVAGTCYFAVAVAMIVGTLLVGPTARRERRRPLWIGLVGLAAGASCLALVGWLQPHSLAGLVGSMMLLGFGSGLLGPQMVAAAMLAEPRFTGTASSLFGAIQGGLTALLSAAASLSLDEAGSILFAIAGTAVAASLWLLIAEFRFTDAGSVRQPENEP